MTRDMSFFMQGKAEVIEEQEHVVSKRYKDEDGKVIPFVFKPLATERIEQIEKECMKPVMQKGRKVGERVDNGRFMARIGVESTVFPDFKDKSLLESYNAVDPVEVLKKVLSIGGEYTAFMNAVQKVNGMDEDFEDMVEDAKN
ncbi:phage tail assembly chaperone [Jeotgalibacillus malaysiensis]|uniref:phage tail assembly chaperone n=1 Tax=Jeotgalibacillus malaysiensis TaxID=1508404 RepID=UPI00385079E6